MPDFTILTTEVGNDPLARGYAGMTDQQVADSLNTANRTVPKPVLVKDVLEYLSKQINGTGNNQRATLSMVREFAEAGTVRGTAPSVTPTASLAARKSACDMVWQMLKYGGLDVFFDVTNANIAAQFVAFGPDGTSGPSVLTSTQLQDIQNLAAEVTSRALEIGWGMDVTAEDITRTRGFLAG